jgi:hypothetical protein
MLIIKLPLVLSFLMILTACGGGGGGGASTSTTPDAVTSPTLNLRTAWQSFGLTTASYSFNFSGVIDGLTLSGSGTDLLTNASPVSIVVIDPLAPFPGPSVNETNLTKVTNAGSGTLIASGTSTAVSYTEELYIDSLGNYILIKDVDENEQTLITSFTPLPTSVTAGSGGTLYNGTIYSRLGYTCGTATSSFTVASETNTSLLVTFTNSANTERQASGQCTTQRITQQVVYRLTASGIQPVRSTGSSSLFSGSIVTTYN